MKKWFIAAGAVVSFAISSLGAAFIGAGSDQWFSNADNWDTYPTTGELVSIAANGTSAGAPAVIDSAFSIDTGAFKLYSDNASDYGTGTSYVHVVSGGTVRSSNFLVGNTGNANFDGVLVVESGGTVAGRYARSSKLTVGGTAVGTYGSMLVEDGATVSFAELALNETGVLTFEMGANSITTIGLTDDVDLSALNGLVQVNLGALTTVGSYTLLDSDLGFTGTLIDDLTTAGGTITDVSQSASFNLLNADGVTWNLTTADSGHDLVLNVTAIPEPATLGLFGIACAGIIALRRVSF